MFVQWQDTITFHARLFRCFLLDNELAVLTQSSEILWALIAAITGQTLLSPLGRPSDAMTRCPPQWGREASSLTSFAIMPTDPPAIPHGLVIDILGSDLSGRAQVPLLNDILFMGVVVWFLLWLIMLAISASWRSSSTARAQSTSNPIIPRPFTVAVDVATNAAKRGRLLSRDQNGTRHLITGVPEDVDIRVSMPGAWHHECRMQSGFEISTDVTSQWFVLGHSQRRSVIFAPSGALVCNPDDETTVGKTLENGGPLMRQINNAIPASDYAESGPSDLNPHESATRCEPPTICDVAVKDLEAPREDGIRHAFIQVPSVDAIRLLCQDLDGDGSTSKDRTIGAEDQGLINVDTRRPSVSTSNRKEDYHVLGRRQDGALSDAGYPLPHRRSYSARREHDISDEVGDDDSYWTEQPNFRLPSPRMWRRSSDVALWPHEGRADDSDNWRVQHREVTRVAPLEKATRRHSSAHMNAIETFSGGTSGDDGSGIYVVPQRRDSRFGSSGPCVLERPTGLPFRKTPSLLTPEGWRTRCLHPPDAPVDDASHAEVWCDSLSLNSVGGQQPDRQPSWRDRYENDPASRRFYTTHQRTITEG